MMTLKKLSYYSHAILQLATDLKQLIGSKTYLPKINKNKI